MKNEAEYQERGIMQKVDMGQCTILALGWGEIIVFIWPIHSV